MSDPRLTYLSQSGQGISVSYDDLPAGAEIVFVDEFGHQSPTGANLAGSGTAQMPISGLKAGQYHLLARNAGGELCQTVDFYIAG